MPCAGVQMSQNTFTQNIGCADAATVSVGCYTSAEMSTIAASLWTYSDHSVMSSIASENIQKTTVESFSTTDNVVLNDGATTVNK
jgi:hypothetical protein